MPDEPTTNFTYTTSGTWSAPTEQPNDSKKLLDLLGDAYDAGADPDLTFTDYLHHAIVGGRLRLDID